MQSQNPPGTGTLRSHPRFLRVWGGQVAGAIGDQLVPVALSLHVVLHGGGAGTVAGVLGGRAGGLVLCLLIGGVLADRMSRSAIVAYADTYRAVLLVATALLLDRLPMGLLALATVLVGAGEALGRPAYRSLVPTLLPVSLLEKGNALVSAGLRSSAVLGALAGASAAALVGTRAALLIAAGTFAFAAFTVFGVRAPAPDRKPSSVLGDARDGLRAVYRRPWAMAVMAATCVQIMAGTAVALTLLPIVAQREFGGGFSYGAVLAATALGALPAVVLAGKWRPKRRGTVSMLVLVCYAGLPLSLLGPLPLPWTIAVFALGGFVVELFFVYWLSALQREIPAELLGKVLALDQLGAFALLPLGYALVGPAVAAFGEGATLLGSGLIVGVTTLATLLVPGVPEFGGSSRPQRTTR
ncbi:MFS transporter [Amycolatopsis anabasis]|uniref:MFS transporter n=1 Tax=Amycolatopsis anabasis TaxID=1840409 RepID=UPI00131DBBB9|nr:MFS transporter [Amycolatopsis anabasis]